MGNIMNFNTIYTKVTAANTANDPAAAALQYGKMIYLILQFTPIDSSSGVSEHGLLNAGLVPTEALDNLIQSGFD
jgi:hypothetical protein